MKIGKRMVILFCLVLLCVVHRGRCLAETPQDVINSHRILGSCGGSDVNLRENPGTESAVIGMLDKGQVLYGIQSEKLADEHPWIKVITDKGQTGWIYGQYFLWADNAMSKENLWKANFDSRVFFTIEGIQNITGKEGEPDNFNPNYKENITSSSAGGIYCDPIFVSYGGRKEKMYFASAWVSEIGYDVGGLVIGESSSEDGSREFGKMLKTTGTYNVINPSGTGWEGPDELAEGRNWWYINTILQSGNTRPERGLCVTVQDGTIIKVWWGVYYI